MWNWLVTVLASKASIVLFEGFPMYKRSDLLIKLADEEQITLFGVSAKYIDALNKSNVLNKKKYKLKNLRTICSTGSPLSEDGFKFIYKKVKSNVHLASISGGTDIVSCFLLGNIYEPVIAGQIQNKGLGMDVDIFNEIKNTGGFIIYGRSDTTLNPGGVRLGTSEIYSEVEKFKEIKESIVIGQSWDNDIRIILFVIMNQNYKLNNELIRRIKMQIRTNASPRHVPSKILNVKDIPRTKNGKIVELAVKNIIEGNEVKNKEALANPEILNEFRNLNELKY